LSKEVLRAVARVCDTCNADLREMLQRYCECFREMMRDFYEDSFRVERLQKTALRKLAQETGVTFDVLQLHQYQFRERIPDLWFLRAQEREYVDLEPPPGPLLSPEASSLLGSPLPRGVLSVFRCVHSSA